MASRHASHPEPDPQPKIQVSLRMDPELKAGLEHLARKRGIPYQTLIQTWVADRLREETQPPSRQELATLTHQVRHLLGQLEKKLRPINP